MKSLRPVTLALWAWSMLTALVAASILFIFARGGIKGYELFIQQWPLEDLPITLASVACAWLLAGVLLYLLHAQRVGAGNLFGVCGFFLVSWTYLNSLSERFRYGDYSYYLDAAQSLAQHKPLPATYLYPPFWATVLQFLIPAGPENFLLVLWLLNFISLMAFYILLQRVLEHYGFSTRLAALVTTLFLLVNTPLLRTLFYVQINLHALNLVLLSLLLFARRPWLSAVSLALAVQLKASPVVLVLAFLLEWDWGWLAWFALSLILTSGITVALDGFTPFLDFLHNAQALTALRTTIFHETSFDSFFRSVVPFLHLDLVWARVFTYAAKALLAGATVWVILRCVRGNFFLDGKEKGARLANALPPLFILMTLASPVVWEHHGLFVALPCLLLLKRLEGAPDWLWFGCAYLLEFILPTFDFLPWSYGRLAAPLILLGLMWVRVARPGNADFFKQVDSWLRGLPIPAPSGA